MTRDLAIQRGLPSRLTAVLSAQPDVVFATLFGSVAKGTARADSDLDVGVLANTPLTAQRKQQLVRDLAVASGRPVDLVDLRNAGPVVLASALRGLQLVGRGSAAHAALLSRAWTDAADFLPVRERILRERRNAWTS
jgi:predicted nucleotidyltransferase